MPGLPLLPPLRAALSPTVSGVHSTYMRRAHPSMPSNGQPSRITRHNAIAMLENYCTHGRASCSSKAELEPAGPPTLCDGNATPGLHSQLAYQHGSRLASCHCSHCRQISMESRGVAAHPEGLARWVA